MKRTITIIFRSILFITGFIISLYIFFPWREAGSFAVSFANRQLSSRGMRLNYSDVSGAESGFTVNNMRLSGMTDITAVSVTIKPELLSSILSLSPVSRISFRSLNVRLGQTMNFGDGSFLLTAGREVLLEDLHTDGEFSLDGYMILDTASMKIGRADAKLEVPEMFRANMNMMKNFLPLVEEGGKWYLRRK